MANQAKVKRNPKKPSSMKKEAKTSRKPKDFVLGDEVVKGAARPPSTPPSSKSATSGYKEWITAVRVLKSIENQRRVMPFLMVTYVFSLVMTYLIVVLEGFGFMHLPEKLLLSIAVATIGEVGALVTLMVKAVYRD